MLINSLSSNICRNMYWACWPDKIMRAQMDGSDAGQVLTGRNHPTGITIDYGASNMYWTEYGGIFASKLDGTNVRVEMTLLFRDPSGIAVYMDQIYWGGNGSKKLQRTSISKSYFWNTYNVGGHNVGQLTTTKWNFPITRPNHCDSHSCDHICLLTISSFRCLPCFQPCILN